MARLIYSVTTSLDGYVADEVGDQPGELPRQPLIQSFSPPFAPPVVCKHPPSNAVEPQAGITAVRKVVDAAPGD